MTEKLDRVVDKNVIKEKQEAHGPHRSTKQQCLIIRLIIKRLLINKKAKMITWATSFSSGELNMKEKIHALC